MRFSLNFVKEFFNPKKSPKGIADLLTMAGLEVETLEKMNGDWIFQVEVTTNRADLLSIFGIANELSAILRKKLEVNFPKFKTKPFLNNFDIRIEDKNDCSLYIARVLKNVKVEESPTWLKERLVNCGLNTINNVVDITNYCMLKWGNPLHAFDLDKIEGSICVRRAKDGEIFIGLDGKERKLTSDNLVIADDKKILALAGIMGAKVCEVDESTKNVLIEAAIFSPLTIRRSRQIAGLNTESSYRFERKVSSILVEVASSEASMLIESICQGKFVGYKKRGRSFSTVKRNILVDTSYMRRYLGVEISKKEAKDILKNLGCQIKEVDKNRFKVVPPFFREDLNSCVDIFEEVARIHGYDKIPTQLPSVFLGKRESKDFEFISSLRNFLSRLGLKEIITYSMVSEESLKILKEERFIRLVNPLRKEENCLRTTLLLGIIESIRYNINQKNTGNKFFEIAHLYRQEKGDVVEKYYLGIGVLGKDNIFYLKGCIEEILHFLNIDSFSFRQTSLDNFSNALFVLKDERILGFLGKLDKRTAESFDLKQDLCFAQIDLEILHSLKKDKIYKRFSRFPLSIRDISIGKREDVYFEEIDRVLREKGKEILEHYEVIDIYRGEKVPDGFVGITLRLYYRSMEKTLTSEEIEEVHNAIRDELSRKEGIILR